MKKPRGKKKARGFRAQMEKLRLESERVLQRVDETDAAVLMHLRDHEGSAAKVARKVESRRKAVTILVKRCQDRLAAIDREYRQLSARVSRLERSPRNRTGDRRPGA